MFTKKQMKEVRLLQKAYMVRLALAQSLKEKANEVEQKILDEHYFTSIQGGRVKSYTDSYLICDEESQKFYDLRVTELRKAGLGHPQDNEGVSVDCVADCKVSDMKKRIVEFVIKNSPKNIAETLEKGQFRYIKDGFVFDKIVDIFLRLK